MEKFNLIDFIARLGNAFAGQNTQVKKETFKKTEEQNTAPNPPAAPAKRSDSELAVVEMLRRHDMKAKEIEEKNKRQKGL